MSKKDEDLEVLKLIWAEQVRYLDRSDRNWDQLRTRARILVFTTIGFASVFFASKKSPVIGTFEIVLTAAGATLLLLNVFALMIIERPQLAGNNEIDWGNFQDTSGAYKTLSREDLNKLTLICKKARNNYDVYQRPFFYLYYAMMISSFVSVVLITFVGIH